MGIFGKILGGGLGWALGGPIGAVVGAFIGHAVDSTKVQFDSGSGSQYRTRAGDFNLSLLVLSAAVMKADGKVMKSELNFVKDFFNRGHNNPDFTREQMQLLKQILEKDIPVKDVCDQIRINMQHPLRLELLHYLFGISKADGRVDKSEVDIISRISSYLGISEKDYLSIKAMFYKDPSRYYTILEINENASDEEVKKAYRKMALKYHPDRISTLGEDFEVKAKEKFQKVQEAYDVIKKERDLK